MITFIIPVYNGAAFLPTLLDSIGRLCPTPRRVIVIDDGSVDGSCRIIKHHASTAIILVRNDRNIGLYGSINKALELVETEYVTLQFQDDVLRMDYMKEAGLMATKYPDASFIMFRSGRCDAFGNRISTDVESDVEKVLNPGPEAWKKALQTGTSWIISGSLNKTAVLRELRFREDLPHCADYELMLRAVQNHKFAYKDVEVVLLRQHQGNSSIKNSNTNQDLREQCVVLRENLEQKSLATCGVGLWGKIAWIVLSRAALRTLVHIRRGRWWRAIEAVGIGVGFLGFAVRRMSRQGASLGSM